MADTDMMVTFGANTKGLDDAVSSSRSLITQFASAIKAAFGGVDTSAAEDSFKRTGDAAQDATDKLSDGSAQASSAVTDHFGAIGKLVGTVIDSMISLQAQTSKIVDPIRNAAGAFDQTTLSMSAISAIAERSGLTLSDLGNSFHELQTKAKSGDDGIVAALNAIGLKASEVANISQDQLAVKMAAAFSTAKDSANKAQAGVILFGDAASKLVPQLDLGAAHMQELAGSANRVGLAIGQDLAAKVQGTDAIFSVASDRISEFGKAWDGLVNGLKTDTFLQFKGAMDGLVQTFNDVTRNVLDLIENLAGVTGAGQQANQSLGLIGTRGEVYLGRDHQAHRLLRRAGHRSRSVDHQYGGRN